MNCPKCGNFMPVVNTASTGENGTLQRRVCPNEKCATVVVAHLLVETVAVDPPAGKGFVSILRRLKEASAEENQSA